MVKKEKMFIIIFIFNEKENEIIKFGGQGFSAALMLFCHTVTFDKKNSSFCELNVTLVSVLI